MQLNKEQGDKHTIQSYSESKVKINSVIYEHNLIVSPDLIIENWEVNSVAELHEKELRPLLALNPEVILIGHNKKGALPPMPTLQFLSKQRLGLESMSIGAACRTFNLLLSENRVVVLGIIFSS